MQKITREQLIAKASELLSNGTVSCVLGWGLGEFDYDVTPAIFNSVEELENGFVFNDFCGANFSKYLVNKTAKLEGKILVFLKPCDTYSFNQLLTEHRFDREKVYAVGIPCEGMADIAKVKAISGDGIAAIGSNGDKMTVTTLFDDEAIVIDTNEVLAERCINCKSKKHVAYDELMGEEGDVIESNRFDEVARLEAMTADERFAFWQTSFHAAFVVMLAVMLVLLVPAKSVFLTTQIQVLKTNHPQTSLKKSSSTLSAHTTWQAAAPTVANAHAYVLKIFLYTFLTVSSLRI